MLIRVGSSESGEVMKTVFKKQKVGNKRSWGHKVGLVVIHTKRAVVNSALIFEAKLFREKHNAFIPLWIELNSINVLCSVLCSDENVCDGRTQMVHLLLYHSTAHYRRGMQTTAGTTSHSLSISDSSRF